MATDRRTYTWNAFESALSSGIDGATSTITLDSVVGLREPEGYLVINPDDPNLREYIKYVTITGTTLQGVSRGLQGGNTNQSHASGALVRAVPMHQHYDDIWDTITEVISDDLAHIAASDPHTAAGYITPTTGDARYLQLSGGGMTGQIDMQTLKIIGLGNPTDPQDAANKTYVDNAIAAGVAPYLPLAGGSMTGNIGMAGNSITALPNPPTLAGEATRKDYVDATAAQEVIDHVGTVDPHSGEYVPQDGGTFTGPVSVDGDLTVNGIVASAEQVVAPGGTVGNPGFKFTSEASGMYLPLAADLRFAVAGVFRLRVTTAFTAIGSTRVQLPSLYDETLPAIYFEGDTDTGINHTANNMGFSTGGIERLKLVNGAGHTINGGPLRAVYAAVGAPDAGDGVNGDLYCDTAGQTIYVKTGATWTQVGAV